MNTSASSDSINELATALSLAQAAMTNATVNRENTHFHNRYADLAAIRDATLPALNKNGLAIMQTTQITDVGAVLLTTLVHKSGQWVAGVYPLPTGVAPQVLGSALTYARRYSWAAVCGIASEEDDDAEATRVAPTNGNGVRQPAAITSEQVKSLRVMINEVNADESAFLRWLGVARLEDIPTATYAKAVSGLGSKRATAAAVRHE